MPSPRSSLPALGFLQQSGCRRLLGKLAVVWLGLGSVGFSQPFDPVLQNAGTLWQNTPESIAAWAAPLGFRWGSIQRESARTTRPDLSLGSIPVIEANLRFNEQKLSALTLLFYTRGDSGILSKEAYEKLVRACTEHITSLTRTRAQPRGQESANAVRAEGLVWKTPGALWTLEFSASRISSPKGTQVLPEFVRLEITPEKTRKPASAAIREGAFNPKSKVRKMSSGDVLLADVPMVDQGDKGYCFPATGERVLRYYGVRADMHELAQLGGSLGGGGTSLSAGLEGLRVAGGRLQFRVRVVDQPGPRDLDNLLREYNQKVLKYGPKEKIPPLRGVVDVQALYGSLRPDVFLAARQAQRVEKSRFLRAIQGAIDAGHPMIWGVLLGLAPEINTPQTSGGHARLIVGYNAKTQECLYSDSWGPGHELKRMSFDTAWLIHQFCFLLIPQGIDSPSLSQDK